MRILDGELQEILKKMPIELLEREVFIQAIDSAGGNPYKNTGISSDMLRSAIDSIVAENNLGANEYEGLDDYKAIQDISDPNERMLQETLMQSPLPGGAKRSVRSIPPDDLMELVEYVKAKREGQTFIKQFETMTSEQVKNYSLYTLPELHEEYSQVDSQYGLDRYQKAKILDYLSVEKMVREAVANIPREELQTIKSKFEEMRNNPSATYSHSSYEKSQFVKSILGGQIEEIYFNKLNIVMIEEAINDRENELNRQNDATRESGFMGKIKSLFGRMFPGKKPKALPESTAPEYSPNSTKSPQRPNGKETWLGSLEVEPSSTGNVRGTNANDNRYTGRQSGNGEIDR